MTISSSWKKNICEKHFVDTISKKNVKKAVHFKSSTIIMKINQYYILYKKQPLLFEMGRHFLIKRLEKLVLEVNMTNLSQLRCHHRIVARKIKGFNPIGLDWLKNFLMLVWLGVTNSVSGLYFVHFSKLIVNIIRCLSFRCS